MATSRQQSRRRLLNFFLFLTITSTSSALNLSQFQVITSNQIPKKCIRAYQNNIDGCTINDFTNGRQCSPSCVDGLKQTAHLIDEACGDLNVTPKSLLGIVLSGGLVNALCPGYQTTTVTKTVQPPSTSGFSTIVPAPTVTSINTKTSSKTSQKTTPTSEASTTIQPTSQESQPAPTTSTEQATTSPTSTDVTSAENTAQPSATSEPAQSSTSSDDSQGDAPTPFIGGSPFDPAPIQSSGNTLCPGFCTEALMATIFAAFFISR